MQRPDWLAVLIAAFVLGAGAYLSTYPVEVVRGVGIALMAISVWGLIVWFLWERRAKVVPAILLFGGITFAALTVLSFGAWYFWPQSKITAEKPWKHTLEQLYASEFPDLGNQEQQITLRMQGNGNSFEFPIRFRLYPDFRSGTEFMSLFIPITNRIDHDGLIFDLVKLLPDEIKKTQQQMHQSVGIGMSAPGMSYRDSQSLVFTGRVYIYTDQPLTVVQLGELTKTYQDKALQLEIRGHDYWWANRDR